MNLTPIIERIKAHCPAFKAVGGMAEFDTAQASPVHPSCYVIPMGEQPREAQGINYALQTVDIEFGVFICVRNAKGSSGQSSLDDLEPLRTAVRDAIYGFTPPGAVSLISYTGGQLLDFKPGLMWWQDGYQTAHHIRSTL